LLHGRTAVVIAHRLSTVRNADQVHVMDGGRIVEQGTHAELIRLKGLYAQLYERQFMENKPAIQQTLFAASPVTETQDFHQLSICARIWLISSCAAFNSV